MRPTKISIDTHALVHNLSLAKTKAPDSRVIAMVKANAYGNGLNLVAQTLSNKVDGFGVSCIDEALELRKLGIGDDIVLFEGCFNQDELTLCQQQGFQVAIHNEQQLHDLLTCNANTAMTVWIKLNTGMNRLGFSLARLADVFHQLRESANVGNILIMTHLATADDPSNQMAHNQIATFYRAAKRMRQPMSLANSAAILAWPNAHADVIRPGIMLYGSSPFDNLSSTQLGLKPVMSFTSQVMAIHQLEPGMSVGYGCRWRAKGQSTIAVVAVGYGDGYPRVVDDKARVFINGAYAPIVGRVSMDMLTIDVTHISSVRLKDKVELWGKHVLIDEVAQRAGTIAYELMCQVTNRPRVS